MKRSFERAYTGLRCVRKRIVKTAQAFVFSERHEGSGEGQVHGKGDWLFVIGYWDFDLLWGVLHGDGDEGAPRGDQQQESEEDEDPGMADEEGGTFGVHLGQG